MLAVVLLPRQPSHDSISSLRPSLRGARQPCCDRPQGSKSGQRTNPRRHAPSRPHNACQLRGPREGGTEMRYTRKVFTVCAAATALVSPGACRALPLGGPARAESRQDQLEVLTVTLESFGDLSTMDGGRRYTRLRTPFGGQVAGAAAHYQLRYRRQEAAAGAVLAQLRAAIDKTPGSDNVALAIPSVPDRFEGVWIWRRAGQHRVRQACGPHAVRAAGVVYLQRTDVCGRTRSAARWPACPSGPENCKQSAGGLVRSAPLRPFDETLFHLGSLIRQLQTRA